MTNISELISQGAIFYVSHSGGKDSQAMYSKVMGLVPEDQIVVVHSDLGDVEWTGVKDHIKDTIKHPLNVVKAVWKDGTEKTLLDYVRHRFSVRPDAPSWPSSAARWCTSELKTGPLYKFMRHDMKAKGALLAVNCMGLRAEESSARAKKQDWCLNKNLSKAGRTVYDWLPIHHLTVGEVFATIADAGQKPFWAYESGNERLSCIFCIMGSRNDIAHGARKNPKLFAKYIAMEKETGYSVFHKETLEQRAGLTLDELINAAKLAA